MESNSVCNHTSVNQDYDKVDCPFDICQLQHLTMTLRCAVAIGFFHSISKREVAIMTFCQF